jgi:hypothetical protein
MVDSGFAKWEGVEEDVAGLVAGVARSVVRPCTVYYQRLERVPFGCFQGDSVVLHLGREFTVGKRVIDGHMGGEEGVTGGVVEVDEDVGNVVVGVLVRFLGRGGGRCLDHLHVTRSLWVLGSVSLSKFSSECSAQAGDKGLDVTVFISPEGRIEEQVVEPRLIGKCAFHRVVQSGPTDHAPLLPRACVFAIDDAIKNPACIVQDDVRLTNEPSTLQVKHLGGCLAKGCNLGRCEEGSEVNRPRSLGTYPPGLRITVFAELNCGGPLVRCASFVLSTISLDSYFRRDRFGGIGSVLALTTPGDALFLDWIRTVRNI